MTAPYFAELADGPEDGAAEWLMTEDGRRIRAAVWGREATKGTVFLLPGRTEYVEKYGRAAGDLAARGFATISVDWRGQGLASRALEDPLLGHVEDFAEFQLDLKALIGHARSLGLPEAWYLLGHSMGGCIGLRALMGAHPFRAAAFSAPMWGIQLPAWQRPFAGLTARLASRIGFGERYAPGTGPAAYTGTAPFEDNTLTTDPEMWNYMGRQVRAEPRLMLGGPTLGWLRAALDEMAALAALPSPELPCYLGIGGNERVVDPRPVRTRMAAWPGGRMEVYEGAEHEIMMDRMRADYFDRMTAFFEASRQGHPP